MGCNQTLTVGDIAQVFDGPHATPKKIEAGPYFLSISSLENGKLDLSKSAHVSDEDFVKWTRRVTPEEGDILFSYETRLGEVAMMPAGVTACLGRRMGLLRPDRSKILPEYLLYAYQSPAFQETIRSKTIHGATVDRIALKELPSFPIQVPPLSEQRKIVDVLKGYDRKLMLNSETNQTLEEMAQTIFKSWFVDFDPVKAKMNGKQPEGMDAATTSLFPEKLVESELGLIPDGWEATDIDNATSKVFSGGTPSTKNEAFWGGELPWFSSGETRNNFIIETEKHITQEGVDGSSTKASAYGDVLIASAGQGHTRGQTSFNSIDCYINQSVVALRASDCVSPYWLYYCLERRYDEMRSVSDSHSSRGSLTTKLLKALPIAKPSKEIVNAFDAIVESLVRKQVANAKQNKELSLLRDTLLPKLLSGEIELAPQGESIDE